MEQLRRERGQLTREQAVEPSANPIYIRAAETQSRSTNRSSGHIVTAVGLAGDAAAPRCGVALGREVHLSRGPWPGDRNYG
jgi:hypothetical protein